LKFISVLLFVSVIFYGFLCAVSLVGYVYPEWASIYELIFSRGIRIISISVNIFLFLSVGNYLFEQALVIESQKSVDSEMQMLNSLNALAYARDNETGNHIIRTQKYVQALAMRLSRFKKFSEILSSVNITLLHNAAPLHDIGKVGIPDSILHKPAKLTDSEWEIMKTHTTIGENVLTSAEVDSRHKSSLLLFATQIAGGHHEKWDGSGYPRGLSGTDIPLAARIMSLADMYDALLSKRVYKEAWSHEEAAREIRSRSGTHFDPEVVDAFTIEQDWFQEISIQYRD
jgi:response regulator RpfG family c-di-GMP phosphodiesterase